MSDENGMSSRVRRPTSEIQEAEGEAFDRRWYDRSVQLVMSGEFVQPDIAKEAARQRERIEKKYGKENLGPYSDFEWGFLAGKHAALRWVLVPDTSWDDGWLGDT